MKNRICTFERAAIAALSEIISALSGGEYFTEEDRLREANKRIEELRQLLDKASAYADAERQFMVEQMLDDIVAFAAMSLGGARSL